MSKDVAAIAIAKLLKNAPNNEIDYTDIDYAGRDGNATMSRLTDMISARQIAQKKGYSLGEEEERRLLEMASESYAEDTPLPLKNLLGRPERMPYGMSASELNPTIPTPMYSPDELLNYYVRLMGAGTYAEFESLPPGRDLLVEARRLLARQVHRQSEPGD